MTTFGERIRIARKKCGMSQHEFSAACGINRSMLARYELDTQAPSLDILVRIADKLDISTDWLLGRTEIPHYYHSGVMPSCPEELTGFIRAIVAEELEARE